MSEKTFTHKDLADLLGVSETTVKSYRRKFPGCIPVANQGKPIRFTFVAAEVATRIRDYFETGMSVEEVRVRLAGEFDWISAEAPKAAGKGAAERAELSPEISVGVSNMAKSMVAMTQQQKALLSRMQGLENLLEDLGLKGASDVEEARRKSAASARERERLIEERLNRLDETTKGLADSVASLTDQLSRFLGQREKAVEDWKKEAASTMAEAAQLVEETAGTYAAPPADQGHSPEQPQPGNASEPPVSKVVPLRPGAGEDRQSSAIRTIGTAAGFGDAVQAEPPRHFFSLPLVVRTGQGQYISAGGRGRGRFSINDLKAMLIYGFTPPNHFTLRWESHGQGWWLYLEQSAGEQAYQLLLMELPTQKGGTVAEVLQVKKNGDALHPAEICAIVDSFGA